MMDTERLTRDAIKHAEESGIVFLDEIDKVCARTAKAGFAVAMCRAKACSATFYRSSKAPRFHKIWPVKTDFILFIASGAFHLAKPSDLLPELQGRLPIRVELAPLSREDMRRILTEPEHSLLKHIRR